MYCLLFVLPCLWWNKDIYIYNLSRTVVKSKSNRSFNHCIRLLNLCVRFRTKTLYTVGRKKSALYFEKRCQPVGHVAMAHSCMIRTPPPLSRSDRERRNWPSLFFIAPSRAASIVTVLLFFFLHRLLCVSSQVTASSSARCRAGKTARKSYHFDDEHRRLLWSRTAPSWIWGLLPADKASWWSLVLTRSEAVHRAPKTTKYRDPNTVKTSELYQLPPSRKLCFCLCLFV